VKKKLTLVAQAGVKCTTGHSEVPENQKMQKSANESVLYHAQSPH